MGYTEPDPRDDLNGMDVARKILILAREAGHELELSDVHVDKLLPEEYFEPESVDDFMNMLPQVDEHMESMRSQAEAGGQKAAVHRAGA